LTTEAEAIDVATFRRILGHYPTGVCVITSITADGDRIGMVVGSFTSVSLDPPLVAFYPDKRSQSWPRIEATGRFCVNVLAAGQGDLCRRFSSRIDDRFDGVSHRLSTAGLPILDGVVAWIDCDLHAIHEAGDHYIALGRVLSLDSEAPERPLLFFQGGYGSFSPFEG
jgi:3-hydroxy-9,10-secoandrosta-1,3,5(10)-triene-9,17-dione monooxygenase reductase component